MIAPDGSESRARAATALVAGYALGFAVAVAALTVAAAMVLGIIGLMASRRTDGAAFVAVDPVRLLLLTPPVAGLALGLVLLGVRAYRRL